MIEFMLTIATWNLQKLTPRSWSRKDSIKQKIQEINADIWVFTEVRYGAELAAEFLPNYSVTTSQEYGSRNADVMICSRFPHQKISLEFQTYETACVLVKLDSNHPLIVYGTIIPYKNFGVVSPTKLSDDQPYVAVWEKHREAVLHQGNDWETLTQKYPNHALCVAGDFNQSRNGTGWYSTPEVEDLLTKELDRNHLICITEKDFVLTNRQNIDHICISRDFAKDHQVSAWENFTDTVTMSDHNGVMAEFLIDRGE
ncbi:endonuclease/exonuclease/phosphatase family protein [Phormidesmis priestleyi]